MDLFEEIQHKVRAQREQMAALIAAGVRPRAFPTPWGFVVVHRATYGETDWRCTMLTKDREPAGHCDAESFAAAMDNARREGADFFSEVSVLREAP